MFDKRIPVKGQKIILDTTGGTSREMLYDALKMIQSNTVDGAKIPKGVIPITVLDIVNLDTTDVSDTKEMDISGLGIFNRPSNNEHLSIPRVYISLNDIKGRKGPLIGIQAIATINYILRDGGTDTTQLEAIHTDYDPKGSHWWQSVETIARAIVRAVEYINGRKESQSQYVEVTGSKYKNFRRIYYIDKRYSTSLIQKWMALGFTVATSDKPFDKEFDGDTFNYVVRIFNTADDVTMLVICEHNGRKNKATMSLSLDPDRNKPPVTMKPEGFLHIDYLYDALAKAEFLIESWDKKPDSESKLQYAVYAPFA